METNSSIERVENDNGNPNNEVFFDENGNRWEINTTINKDGNTVEFATVYKGDTDEKIDSSITEYKGNSDVILKKSNDTLVVPQNPAVLNDTSDHKVFYDENGNRWEVDTTINKDGNTVEFSTVYKGDTNEKIDSGITEYKGNSDVVLKKSNDTLVVPQNPAVLNDTSDHKAFYDENGNRWEVDTTINKDGNTVEFATVYKGDTDEKIDSSITEYKGNSDVILKKTNDTLVVPQNPAVSEADSNHKEFYDEYGNRWEVDAATNTSGNTVEYSTVYKGDTDEKIDSSITEYKGNSDVILKKSITTKDISGNNVETNIIINNDGTKTETITTYNGDTTEVLNTDTQYWTPEIDAIKNDAGKTDFAYEGWRNTSTNEVRFEKTQKFYYDEKGNCIGLTETKYDTSVNNPLNKRIEYYYEDGDTTPKIKSYTFYNHDDEGRLLVAETRDGNDNTISTTVYSYDDSNLSSTTTYTDGKIENTKYFNNNIDYPTEKETITVDADGKKTVITEKYAELSADDVMRHNGPKVKEITDERFKKDGTFDSKSVSKINDDGNITEYTEYESTDKAKNTTKYSYDDDGTMTRQEVYDGDGSEGSRLTQTVDYKYGDNGEITEIEKYYNDDGTVGSEKTIVRADGTEHYTEVKYEYDDGKLTSGKIYTDGEYSGYYEYEYDEDGNYIRSEYDKDGLLVDVSKFDKDNNKISGVVPLDTGEDTTTPAGEGGAASVGDIMTIEEIEAYAGAPAGDAAISMKILKQKYVNPDNGATFQKFIDDCNNKITEIDALIESVKTGLQNTNSQRFYTGSEAVTKLQMLDPELKTKADTQFKTQLESKGNGDALKGRIDAFKSKMDMAKEFAQKDLLHIKAEAINAELKCFDGPKTSSFTDENGGLAGTKEEQTDDITLVKTVTELKESIPGPTESDPTTYRYDRTVSSHYKIDPLEATVEVDIGSLKGRITRTQNALPYTEGDIEKGFLN